MMTFPSPMPSPGENIPYSLIQRLTRDADDQADSLSEWQQAYQQLSAGQFEGQMTEVQFDGIQVFRERTSQAVEESCATRPDAIALGIPVTVEGTGWYGGRPLSEQNIMLLVGGDNVVFRTPRALDLVAITLPREALLEHLDATETPLRHHAHHTGLWTAPPEQTRRLREFLCTLLQSLATTPEILRHGEMRDALRQAVLATTVSIFGKDEEALPRSRTIVGRQNLVARAKDYMMAHIDQPITIPELCKELGVSRRTLQYCFNEVLELNPVAYIRTLRLNGVRRELKSTSPVTATIQDIAARWGFWHLSRFAAEYRAHFGELPSQTRRAGLI